MGVCMCTCVMCSHPHIHLSGRQGDAADQNLRLWKKMQNMKKQMAFRRAPPGQPVPPNPYDDSDEETLQGDEEEIEEERDEEPAQTQDSLPRLRDIAQVHLFFNFPCICFCLVPAGAWRQACANYSSLGFS